MRGCFRPHVRPVHIHTRAAFRKLTIRLARLRVTYMRHASTSFLEARAAANHLSACASSQSPIQGPTSCSPRTAHLKGEIFRGASTPVCEPGTTQRFFVAAQIHDAHLVSSRAVTIE